MRGQRRRRYGDTQKKIIYGREAGGTARKGGASASTTGTTTGTTGNNGDNDGVSCSGILLLLANAAGGTCASIC